jgi:glutaminyl-peptide cyclotransferase
MTRLCKIPAAFLVLLPAYSGFRQTGPGPLPSRTPEYTFTILHAFPHDPAAFTQGLAWRDGFLYEGTGLQGASSLRKVRLETGEVTRRFDLAPDLFGEGITFHKNQIIQLTWLGEKGFVYDAEDFHLLRQFSYRGEGWGLAANGANDEIFMSDGTAEIRVLNGETLAEKRRFTVRDGAKPVDQLNELEYVEGELFANVWQSDRIAYDPIHKRLFVTGKLWPKVFEIRLLPAGRSQKPAKPGKRAAGR